MNRLAASITTSSLFILILFGSIGLIGMKLVIELTNFFNHLPEILTNANSYLKDLLKDVQSYSNKGAVPFPDQLEQWLSNMTSALGQLSLKISNVLLKFASGVPDFFVFFIVFIIAVYLFSLGLPSMHSTFLSIFEEKSKLQVKEVLESLRNSVFGFLRAQLLISMITYIITFIGLLVIGTNYPLAIALLIVVVDILPILGTGSVLIPWAIYQMAFGETYVGVGLLVLFLVITVVRRIVEPKILGDAVGIGALSALISLYVGYELVGIIGVFLGPIVVIVFTAMSKAGLFDFKIKI